MWCVALGLCSAEVIPPASRLVGVMRAAALAPPAPGLLVCDVVVGRWGSGCEEYHVVLKS